MYCDEQSNGVMGRYVSEHQLTSFRHPSHCCALAHADQLRCADAAESICTSVISEPATALV